MGRCPSASGWSRKSKGVVTAGQAGWLLPCGICDYFLDLVWFLTNSFTCYMYMRYSTTIAFVYLEKREIVEMYLDLPWGFQTSGRENRYSLCIPFVRWSTDISSPLTMVSEPPPELSRPRLQLLNVTGSRDLQKNSSGSWSSRML